jgi:UPF0716 protein FxsA
VLVGLLVLAVVEIYVLIRVGELIGPLATIGLLLAVSALGVYLIAREGAASWRRLQATVREGRAPTADLTDTALVLAGGLLLIAPGFVSDVVGFFCVLPPTRPLARRALLGVLRRRVRIVRFGPGGPGHGPPGGVIRGEIVDD